MKTAKTALLAAGIAAATATTAHAGIWQQEGGPVTIWVTVKSLPGESSWQTCRRLYQRDVYGVYKRGNKRVRCRIDHSRVYDYQNRRQNFNN